MIGLWPRRIGRYIKGMILVRSLLAFVLLAIPLLGLIQAAPARADDVIRLGAVVSLTGPRAEIASHVVNGYDLGVKRINEMGGVKVGNRAYRLEIVYADDQSSSTQAGRATEQLIRKEDIDFLLGPVSSSLVIETAAVAERFRIPLVQTGAASLRVYEQGYTYNFGILTMADRYLAGAIDLAAERELREGRDPSDLKVAKAFLSDAFSKDIRTGVNERLKNWSMSVVVDEFLPDPVLDIRGVLDKVGDASPDLLVLSGRAQGAQLLARQLAETRTYVPMVALTHCDGAGIEELGRRADYLICASQWDPNSLYKDRWFGSSADFSVDFELEFGYEPPYQGAEGTAVILVLVDALERAATIDRTRVRESLARTNLETFFGPIRFDSTGRNMAKDMVLLQIQGGRYQVVWPKQAATSLFLHPIPKWKDRF